MHEIFRHPSLGQAKSRAAESAGVRLAGNLSQASMHYPMVQQPWLARENRVALRMRDDGGQPSYLDVIKNAIELLRDELVREFN